MIKLLFTLGGGFMGKIRVHLEVLGRYADKGVKRGDVIVVIDVFRCSSTIVMALKNGAKAVIPVKTVKEAIKLHEKNPDWILAGERMGRKPKDFQLGNSPLEYRREAVKGKYIILTTTDGTKAIEKSKGAEDILIGALINVSAVSKLALSIARSKGKDITLVASGRCGEFSLEDFLCAGKIAELMRGSEVEFSDSALAALLASRGAGRAIGEIAKRSYHATYLKSLGLSRDVDFCSRLDLTDKVPSVHDGIAT
ncbi:2-phosphosulfolactate phosphatase [Candidatus Bathyarchaeota archaeon]|nr:MAG: 2-phosphosulfolactate phosphatase [Candidatus Bathyarchaeota archaeon]